MSQRIPVAKLTVPETHANRIESMRDLFAHMGLDIDITTVPVVELMPPPILELPNTEQCHTAGGSFGRSALLNLIDSGTSLFSITNTAEGGTTLFIRVQDGYVFAALSEPYIEGCDEEGRMILANENESREDHQKRLSEESYARDHRIGYYLLTMRLTEFRGHMVEPITQPHARGYANVAVDSTVLRRVRRIMTQAQNIEFFPTLAELVQKLRWNGECSDDDKEQGE